MADQLPSRYLIAVDPDTCETVELFAALCWLTEGGVVAFPTETYYGLAVNPRSSKSVKALYEVKGRDPAMAIPLIAASIDVVRDIFGLDGRSKALAERFWPGPLSLVLEAPLSIAPMVHGGTGTIAVRVSPHRVAQQLAGGHEGLITATSANLSGLPPASSFDALRPVRNDPRVLAIDAGTTAGGRPSTIVDARHDTVKLVREGAVPWSRVLESI